MVNIRVQTKIQRDYQGYSNIMRLNVAIDSGEYIVCMRDILVVSIIYMTGQVQIGDSTNSHRPHIPQLIFHFLFIEKTDCILVFIVGRHQSIGQWAVQLAGQVLLKVLGVG